MRALALTTVSLAIALSACANKTDPEILKTTEYQAGYADGCTTGNQYRAGFKETKKRNDTLFETNRAYQIGWNQGFSACGGSQTDRNRQDYLFEDRFDQGPI